MKHEEKRCPRCQCSFECKVGSITLCQCATIKLNDEERAYIRGSFHDCLCASCMEALKAAYHAEVRAHKLQVLLRR